MNASKTTKLIEGSEALKRFKGAMKQVLSVSHEELQRRIEAERKKSAMKAIRPGPKPKKTARHRVSNP